MRRIIAALIVVMIAVALVGCGGGGDEPTTPETDTEAPPTPPTTNDAATEEDVTDFSPVVDDFPMPFPDDPAKVPSELLDRVEAGQPMLIFFYDEAHKVADDMESVVASTTAKYRGLIDLVEYPLADDFADVLETGDFDPEGDLSEEELTQLKNVYEFADVVGVGYTPFIILVDREGTITWMFRGYVDRETLELQVLYATQ